jgi:hypothetical protein
MSVLAFKALDYGAEKIPDKLFERIPGGFFTPSERKKIEKNRHPEREPRNKSEQRRGERERRRAERDRTPPTDYSDYSDTDHERDARRKERRRRARSLGRSISRSLSRGRHHNRGRDVDDESDMERAERGAHFDPPPGSEYRPYNPQEYAAPPPATGPSAANGYHDPYDQRAYSARPDYGYPPQVNTAFRSRSVTAPVGRPASVSPHSLWPKSTSRTPSSLSMPPLFNPPSPNLEGLRSGTPLGAVFTPSYEPPMAALLSRPTTNPIQPPSQTAARYTPAAGYAPSPVNASIPPPSQGYAPYNPADYASPNQPPPFYRQRSLSQSSLPQPQYSDSQYPDSRNQIAPYNPPPGRHGSTAPSHRRRDGDGKRHRARSVGHHGQSQDSVTAKVRDRFENLDIHDKNLAASVGGALAGGFAGSRMGHGTLSTLIGAGIGAIGGREMEKRLDK